MRDDVRAALGLGARERWLGQPSWGWSRQESDSAPRSALALRFWNEAHDPRGTIVEGYLASRGLALSEDITGEVIRFHPTLRFDGELVGAMVALFRDITSNEPCGILRTFLDGAGRKRDRRMLGRTKNAAIKLDADENVTLGLIIGEGLETSLAAQLAGFHPVWALGSASAIAAFLFCQGSRRLLFSARLATGVRTAVRPEPVPRAGLRASGKHSWSSLKSAATLTTYGGRWRHDRRISATRFSLRPTNSKSSG